MPAVLLNKHGDSLSVSPVHVRLWSSLSDFPMSTDRHGEKWLSIVVERHAGENGGNQRSVKA